MNTDKTLNDILVKLFNDLMEIEDKCLITGEFRNISNNDMHVIEAIGVDEPKSMTQVAHALNITTGTLTKSIDALVEKKYVERHRSNQDKRVIRLSLTDAGVRAYEHHARFHANMIEDIKQELDEDETRILIATLGKLVVFFQNKYKEYLERK
ncbi:MAG: winged helix DNA-binding protein [Lachnospiraceae bacterium]|nr:winged helix DNA-binding protein [Lachnospiraceae bacterium]